MIEIIPLLHADHQFLDVQVERKSTVSSESVKEIFSKVPSIPGNDGATFVSFLCAEVQLVATHALQEENTRDLGRTVWRALDKDLSCSSLDVAQVNELLLMTFKNEAVVRVWHHVR